MRRLLLLSTLIASPVIADDAALLLGVSQYDALGRLSDRDTVADAAGPFARAGFDTIVGTNATISDMHTLADRFFQASRDADRLVIGLSGFFVTDGETTWLLGEDSAERPTSFDIGTHAISVDAALRLLAQTPGQSVLAIGHEPDDADLFDPYFRTGLGDLDIPQGVTVVVGEPSDVTDFLADIAEPGADVIGVANEGRRLGVAGFAPGALILVSVDADESDATPQTVDTVAEDALWQGAEALDTPEAYLDYLSKYPTGQYAAAAQAQLNAINSEPNRQDRLAEDALTLGRDQRRDIQRDLTLLDYNTRGIDGIFGPGTRSAITNWQQQSGFAQTSYLTADQINQLDAQAARRAAEIEAEAARARAEEDRRDRAFWQETGAGGDEPGYRAYLDRFPDGIFSAEARTRLEAIEADKLAVAEGQDRSGWDRAKATDTVAGYRDYLTAFPNGAFREDAEDRIAAFAQAETDAAATQDAEAAEVELNVDPITARLIEGKLASLGLDPGNADGEFTEDTRRALRIYQRDRGLPQSGFLDRATVSRLLADTLGDISR